MVTSESLKGAKYDRTGKQARQAGKQERPTVPRRVFKLGKRCVVFILYEFVTPLRPSLSFGLSAAAASLW